MNTVNPFLPGDGQTPPHLAGRADEQAILRRYLPRLQGYHTIANNVALVGPRGNGKTALLRWFEQEIRKTNKIDAVWLTPDDMPDMDKLANSLVPPGRFDSLLPDTLSFSIGMGQVGWELGAQPLLLTGLLTARCAQQPLVVLLDEAHTLDPVVGNILLNTSQKVRTAAPFLLALAGTPGLREHLNTTSATFWNRCEKLGIGRLDEMAAAAALEKPLTGEGVTFTGAALGEVVAESQCYPYFIQLWGAALWDHAQKSSSAALDTTDVVQARPTVARRQDAYYQDRRAELKRLALLPVAEALADAFAERSSLQEHIVDEIIAAVLPRLRSGIVAQTEKANINPSLWVIDRLRDLGYIWQYPACNDWEPGIPSLMEYVRSQAAPKPLPANPPLASTP